MYAPAHMLLALIFTINQCLGQNACPAIPPNSCNVISRPKAERRGLHCGVLGTASHPVTVKDVCITATSTDCRDYCLNNDDCHSFSFRAGEINAGSCSLYNGSVVHQGFHADNSSITSFYNRHCYRYDCPHFGCPSSSFHLQVSNSVTKYKNLVIQRALKLTTFTSDITEASSFHLNSDCQLLSHGRLGSDGVSSMTNPDLVNGPLYFYSGRMTKHKKFSTPTCTLDSSSFDFTCNYADAGGSGDETFFSCFGGLGLGTYPGDGNCESGDGDIKLTAFDFH